MIATDRLSDTFAALADPTRRAILARLASGEATVTELAEPFEMSLPAVSKHLQVLEQSGVIHTEKTGRVRTCRIEPAGLGVAERWIAERRSLWERRLDRLGEILAEDEQGETRVVPRGKGKRK